LNQAAWEALGNIIGTISKETLPSLLKVARDAVSNAKDKERRKRKVRITYSINYHKPKYYTYFLRVVTSFFGRLV
jgi:hypothetical protein